MESTSRIQSLKKIKPTHGLAILLVLFIGAFNSYTWISPQIKQRNYERGIKESFDAWWNITGRSQFLAVGLTPTEKIMNEEFAQFRERALEQKPSYIVEDRLATINKDFRNWWELEGGKESFANEHGRYPNEADFKRELDKWISNYTDKFIRYSLAYIPQKEDYSRMFTCWLLMPSVWSYAIFAIFFIFAVVQLERRFTWYVMFGFAALWACLGALPITILTSTSFFDHYAGERYMGLSLALTFMLGACTLSTKKVSQLVSATAFAGLLADIAVNWFVNPGIFGAVAVFSPISFGLGALAGAKIEPRRKTKRELQQEALQERIQNVAEYNPAADSRARVRSLLNAGFESAKSEQFNDAQRLLTQAFSLLLQEAKLDIEKVNATAERIASPKMYIEISSNQWLEWGETAKNRNAPKAAIILLRKCLTKEKDKNFARRALFLLGETCVRFNIEIDDGVKNLQKVIELNDSDFIAKQAKSIIANVK